MSKLADILQNNTIYQSFKAEERQVCRTIIQNLLQVNNLIDLTVDDIDFTLQQIYRELQRQKRGLVIQEVQSQIENLYSSSS